jgi:hypothetical protein
LDDSCQTLQNKISSQIQSDQALPVTAIMFFLSVSTTRRKDESRKTSLGARVRALHHQQGEARPSKKNKDRKRLVSGTNGSIFYRRTCFLVVIVCAAAIVLESAKLMFRNAGLITTQDTDFQSTVKLPVDEIIFRSTTTLPSAMGEQNLLTSDNQGMLTCSSEQLRAVRRQLPGTTCLSRPWTQSCSFTKATKGCQSPELWRQFFAYDQQIDNHHPFLALYVGWQRQDDAFVDTLYVGSNRNPSFQWDPNPKSCRGPLTIYSTAQDISHRSARVMVVEWGLDRYQILQSMQTKLPEDSVILDQTDLAVSSLPQTLTKIVQSQLFSTETSLHEQPIHYVKLDSGALDYHILTQQMTGLLPNIRYLAFDDNWKGDWGDDSAKLSVVIGMLKEHGLICYWAGDSDAEFGLWRITDCWQDFYDFKNWARIACVSHTHSDVAKLAVQMEHKFLETIQKVHAF